MFEYLMPMLVMRSFPVHPARPDLRRGASARQIAYGARARRALGRERERLQRARPPPDLSVSRLRRARPRAQARPGPRAGGRALRLGARGDGGPASARWPTSRALESEGALGPLRLPRRASTTPAPTRTATIAVVGTYMAHHIGMGLVALTNALTAQRLAAPLPRRPAGALGRAAAARADPAPAGAAGAAGRRARTRRCPSRSWSARRCASSTRRTRPQPHVALLGHLPYTIMVSHCGGGYSRYEALAVTRWRVGRDPRRDRPVLLREGPVDRPGLVARRTSRCARRPTGTTPSSPPTGSPSTAPTATSRPAPRSRWCRRTRPRCAGSPSPTTATRPREIELTSYGEIVLAPPEADRAHPAFGNLFVETEWHEWCTRHHRHPPPALGQRSSRSGACTWSTAGEERVGAGDLRDRPGPLPRTGPLDPRPGGARRRRARCRARTGAVLDPIFALRTRVRLEPGPVGVGGVHHARRHHAGTGPSSWPTATTIRTPRSARSTWPGPRARSSCASSTSPRATPRSSRSWPATSSTASPALRAPQAELPAEPRLAAAALGHRRLGRLADPARDHRLARGAAHAAPAARGAPLLAPARDDGGPGRAQRAPAELPAGPGATGSPRRCTPWPTAARSTGRAACSSGGATCSAPTSCSCCAPPRGCTSPATAARSAGSWRRPCRRGAARGRRSTRRPRDPGARAERLAGDPRGAH